MHPDQAAGLARLYQESSRQWAELPGATGGGPDTAARRAGGESPLGRARVLAVLAEIELTREMFPAACRAIEEFHPAPAAPRRGA